MMPRKWKGEGRESPRSGNSRHSGRDVSGAKSPDEKAILVGNSVTSGGPQGPTPTTRLARSLDRARRSIGGGEAGAFRARVGCVGGGSSGRGSVMRRSVAGVVGRAVGRLAVDALEVRRGHLDCAAVNRGWERARPVFEAGRPSGAVERLVPGRSVWGRNESGSRASSVFVFKRGEKNKKPPKRPRDHSKGLAVPR